MSNAGAVGPWIQIAELKAKLHMMTLVHRVQQRLVTHAIAGLAQGAHERRLLYIARRAADAPVPLHRECNDFRSALAWLAIDAYQRHAYGEAEAQRAGLPVLGFAEDQLGIELRAIYGIATEPGEEDLVGDVQALLDAEKLDPADAEHIATVLPGAVGWTLTQVVRLLPPWPFDQPRFQQLDPLRAPKRKRTADAMDAADPADAGSLTAAVVEAAQATKRAALRRPVLTQRGKPLRV